MTTTSQHSQQATSHAFSSALSASSASSVSAPRIAFVLKGYPRVSETFIAQEIHLLERQGFDIEIISLRKAREPERQPIVDQIKAPVTYLPESILPALAEVTRANFKALTLHPVSYLTTFLSALIRSIRTHRRSPFKRFLQAGWLIGHRRLASSTATPTSTASSSPRPLHLHSHFIHAPTELTYYVSMISGLRYSISAHAKDIYTIPPADVRTRVNASALLMTCTRFNHDFLRAIPRIHADKIHLVYHGIDLETFRPLRLSPTASSTPPPAAPDPIAASVDLTRFVSIGRLVAKKGYDDILRALRLLKDKGVSFTYDIYGAGRLKAELIGLRDRLGLERHVVFHDVATHPQIIARLREGGLFLCGSRLDEDGDRDGIPNTIAEAMSMELPVLATRVSGIPELIEDGVNGRLVPEKDPEAFAAAIEELLADPAGTLALGRAARIRVERVFNCHVWIETCAALLKGISQK